jgi:hypothetical protein
MLLMEIDMQCSHKMVWGATATAVDSGSWSTSANLSVLLYAIFEREKMMYVVVSGGGIFIIFSIRCAATNNNRQVMVPAAFVF